MSLMLIIGIAVVVIGSGIFFWATRDHWDNN